MNLNKPALNLGGFGPATLNLDWLSVKRGLLLWAPFQKSGDYWSIANGRMESLATETVDADGTRRSWGGQIVRATANAARAQPGRGVLVEGARTNLFTYSELFSNAAWSSSRGTLTPGQVVGPDGTLSGWLFTRASSTNRFLHQSYDLDGDTACVWGIVKKNAFDTVALCGNSSAVTRIWTFSTETFSGATGTATTGFEALGGGWYLIWMSYTGHADAKVHGLYHLNTVGANCYVYALQLEKASFPSSYIPTTSGSVERAADDLQIDNTGEVHLNAAAGTVLLALTSIMPAPSTIIAFDSLLFLSEAGGVTLFRTALGKYQINVRSGTTVVADLQSSPVAAGLRSDVLAMAWAANDFRLYVNGGDEQADTAGAAPLAANTSLFVGQSRTRGTHIFGSIAHLIIFNRALSAGEILAATRDIQRISP